jgi:hypothetical protein
MTPNQIMTIAHALHDCLCSQVTPLGEAMGISEQLAAILSKHCPETRTFDWAAFKLAICKNDGSSLERHCPEEAKSPISPAALNEWYDHEGRDPRSF